MIGGISPKVLTETLRRLERPGWVEREAFAEAPPRVEYALPGWARACWADAGVRTLSELARRRGGAARSGRTRRHVRRIDPRGVMSPRCVSLSSGQPDRRAGSQPGPRAPAGRSRPLRLGGNGSSCPTFIRAQRR